MEKDKPRYEIIDLIACETNPLQIGVLDSHIKSTEDKIICECYDIETAEKIAAALNWVEDK